MNNLTNEQYDVAEINIYNKHKVDKQKVTWSIHDEIHSFMNPLNALFEGIGQCSYGAPLAITVHNVHCKDPATVSFRVTLPLDRAPVSDRGTYLETGISA